MLVGYCRVKLLHRHEEACKREGEKREQIMEKNIGLWGVENSGITDFFPCTGLAGTSNRSRERPYYKT